MSSTAASPLGTGASPARLWIAYVALCVGVICISWSALFVRWAGVSGPASAFYRVLVATVILIPVWVARRKSPPTRRAMLFAALAGAFFAIDLTLFNTAVLSTSAANATLLGNNSPVMVGLGSWIIFKKRPSGIFWVGLSLALIGSAGIVGSDMLRHATFGSGDAMAITASLFFAAYLITIERVRSGVDTLTLTTLAVTASCVTSLLLCLILRVPLLGFAPHAWISLVGLGIVSQLGGYLAITYALGHLPATITSVGLLGQAPLTALLAIPLLGESLGKGQLIGGTLVLIGIYVVNSRYRPA